MSVSPLDADAGEAASLPAANGTGVLGGPSEASVVVPAGTQYWEIPFLAVVCVIGVTGNLLVVAVYSKKALRNTNAGLYILNLAAGDIFLLVFVVAFHITEYYPATWPVLWRHDAQCILHRYGRFVGFNVTTFTMVASAVNQYTAVCHSLLFRARCTVSRTKKCVLLTWVLAAVTAIPSVTNFGAKYNASGFNITYVGKTPFACRSYPISIYFKHFKIIYISVILFWVPVLMTAATYTAMVVYVWQNNKRFRQCTSASRSLRSHWRVARTLLTVFCVYALSYVFLAVFNLASQYATLDVPALVRNVGLLLPYANSSMNPLVYLLVNQTFRSGCRKLLPCRWMCRSDGIKKDALGPRRPVGSGDRDDGVSSSNGARLATISTSVSGVKTDSKAEATTSCESYTPSAPDFTNLAFTPDDPMESTDP